MSIVPNRSIIGASANQGGYTINKSLRFRSSASAYLSRTPASASNRTTWTWSGWVKLGKIDQTFTLFRAGVTNDTNNRAEIDIDSYSQSLVFYSADGGVTKNYLVATPVMRDPSAWYHVMCVYDSTNATASNRVKLYLNGSQITALSTATYAAQNTTTVINNNVFHVVSYNNYSSGPAYSDGYLAEVNFIDGQALTPSSFGATDPVTGAWVPAKYTGTYGTNGFYLPFSDNTSATTLAYDKSGNNNNWTPNNISTTAGATYDSMTDVPTLTSATAANYCRGNPLSSDNDARSIGVADGGLWWNCDNTRIVVGSMAMTSGKWYWEHTVKTYITGIEIGITGSGRSYNATYVQPSNNSDGYGYISTGNKRNNGSSSSYGSTYTSNDVIGVAFDADAGTLTFYKNGTSQGTAYTGISGSFYPYNYGLTGSGETSAYANFGQRPFAYTPPTGFKALNAYNLPDPTIKAGNKYMDATLYTGTGASQSIVNAGGFQPDFIWFKCRNYTYDHNVWDSTRGVTKLLITNKTNGDVTISDALTSFNSNGFTIGADVNGIVNDSTRPYVGWQWKAGGTAVTNTAGSITSQVSANTTAGFSVVTYTGTGSTGTIGHGLGVAPSMIIVKSRNASNGWYVCHVGSWGGDGNGLFLNNTSGIYNRVSDLGGTGITAMGSSTFTATTGSGTFLNTSGTTYVAYCWAQIPGYSSFGTYVGNYLNDGPFVYTGFKVKWLLVKNIVTGATSWFMEDGVRDPYNVVYKELCPNSSAAERTVDDIHFDFLSNGFKARNQSWGHNYNTYIYIAFAENPFKYSNAR